MPSGKILLIDDDPSVTKLLEAKLQARGDIAVAAANAPRAGIDLAQSFQPDLIVCDIDLGDDLDGGMVAHQLQSNPATASVPLVFLSSMVTPGDAARQTGGRRMISKKSPIAEIIELIVKELP